MNPRRHLEPLRHLAGSTLSALRYRRRPAEIGARHAEWTIISSADDLQPPPSGYLLDIATEAIQATRQVDVSSLESRCSGSEDQTYVRTWPGEHYRLLPGLCSVVKPQLAVEVGTFTGLGTLALAQGCPRVVTYDLLPWDSFPTTALRDGDLADGRIEQRLCDLADTTVFAAQRDLLEQADLLFVDGPKDGSFEPRFLELVLPVVRRTGALLVFDDIRVLPMVRLWRDLDLPKLDLTSFGHWSGTGIASAR